MSLTQILILSMAALAYGLLLPARLRGWVLLLASVFGLYWLQPALPIRYLDFALPTATLILSVWIWAGVRQTAWERDDSLALALSGGMVLGIAATRYLIKDLRPTPSRPPDIVWVFLALVAMLAVFTLLDFIRRRSLKALMGVLMAGVVGIFIVLKQESLTRTLAEYLRGWGGQAVDLANPADIQWLGFSYVAFRLIHILRDRQVGKLPSLTLREHLTYILFLPALTAGPIDRAERFITDIRELPSQPLWQAPRLMEGVTRISIGLFKKFALADALALIALNATNATQITTTAGLWLHLYLYAWRLFWDFSGYTDIAIGIGILLGFRLPENFERPYLKANITAFWQSWHMTLSSWVRFYVFFPLSRSLLRLKRRPNPTLVVLIAHLSTMIVIGLWHGITVNFLIWGVWHGLGLFVHKLWSDRTRKHYRQLQQHLFRKRAWMAAGMVLTFHYVALGWVWFSLPDFSTAADVFLKLWGVW